MKLLTKIRDWVVKNKAYAVIIGMSLILFIILLIILLELLLGGSSNKYGNRLDEIEDVQIDSAVFDGVKEELNESGLVENVSTRIQGKIVYTTIILKYDTGKDRAKQLAAATLDNYEEDELKYYDFSFFLEWKGEEENMVITGNKHHNLDEITWTNN